jgi:hypothetical protein
MTDPVAIMTYDMTIAASSTAPGAQAPASLYDVARFDQLYQGVAQPGATAPAIPAAEIADNAFSKALKLLESLDGGEGIGKESLRILANNAEMSPSEMIGLTMKAHHFLFQSELTANIANKSSEGLQQLFRQQS